MRYTEARLTEVAQALLAKSSRLAERLRIAHELHDLIGHHLTALSLNLEVAGGKAKAHIETSQGLAKELLSDVREAVGSLRAGGLELSGAIVVLVQDIPTPKVHVEVADALKIDDPQRAQVLLRVVQEVITNTVRHARAENLWLRLEPATTVRVPGHLGMVWKRPLELHPNPGRGFALTATLPA